MLTGPIRVLRGSQDVTSELRFMMKHIDRKSNEVIFRKFVDPRCDHCSSSPIISTEAWNYLKEREFKWPNPIPSTADHPGHFKTFIEIDKLDSESITTGMFLIHILLELKSC